MEACCYDSLYEIEGRRVGGVRGGMRVVTVRLWVWIIRLCGSGGG